MATNKRRETYENIKETWKAIPEHPGYEASDQGRIRTRWQYIRRGSPRNWYWRLGDYWVILRQRLRRKYFCVSVRGHQRVLVHVLVLFAFVGPRPIIPGVQVVSRHLNDVKTDNRLCNLTWGTQKENMEDAIRNGVLSVGHKHYKATLSDSEVVEIRGMYERGELLQKELAVRYEVDSEVIRHVVNNTTWKHLPPCKTPHTSKFRSRKKLRCGINTVGAAKAKLTEDDVRQIRRLYAKGNRTQRGIAEDFGVTIMSVNLIVRGKIWKHVT